MTRSFCGRVQRRAADVNRLSESRQKKVRSACVFLMNMFLTSLSLSLSLHIYAHTHTHKQTRREGAGYASLQVLTM